MNRTQNRKLQRYVDSLRPMLGLDAFEVDVFDEALEPEDPALATVIKHYARKCAFAFFRDDFFEYSPAYQRHVVIHELLHCVHAAPEQYIFEVLDGHLPKQQYKLLADSFRHHHEYAVDGLAVAIAPLFPLPSL